MLRHKLTLAADLPASRGLRAIGGSSSLWVIRPRMRESMSPSRLRSSRPVAAWARARALVRLVLAQHVEPDRRPSASRAAAAVAAAAEAARWAARSPHAGAARAGRRARTGDADPHVDVAFESRSRPTSRSGFLRRYRGWLFVGLVLVALDAICTLAGPLLVRYGIDNGVAHSTAPTRSGPRRSCSSSITLFDWWVMWAEARVMGRISERLLHALRDQGLRAPATARRRLLRARDGGPDHDPHDHRHRRAVAAAAERARQRARQPRDVPRRRHRARVHRPAARARSPRSILPPLVHRDDLVPVGVDHARTRSRASASRAVNANLQEGLSGVRVSQAFVREDRNQEVFDRDRRPATATRACTRSGSSRSTSRSSTSSPTSRRASCSARAACSSRTARCRSAR